MASFSFVRGAFLTGPSLSRQVLTTPIAPRYFTLSGQACEGSSLKDVKARIKSVGSIRKITKTMNMIATARLRAAQNRMEKSRNYYSTLKQVFENIPPVANAKKDLILTISSDKGLCGAVNSAIVKVARIHLRGNDEKGVSSSIACIGEKAPAQLGREQGSRITWSAGETSKRPLSYVAVGVLADRLLANDFDVSSIIYNKFNTIISYTTTTRVLSSYPQLITQKELFDEYEFEEDNSLFHIQDLMEHHYASFIFAALSDSSASELGGRMSSMDNATKNAGEMIKKLSIEYNRRRQAAITTELNEIISGASAIQ